MGKIDDLEYIGLVLNGDTQAFAVLVNKYKDMVFTLSMKMIRNREEAEEAAQDSFLKLYRSLSKFKGDSKFSTWLYKITYNNCLDRIKKVKRVQTTVAIDEFTESDIRELTNFMDRIDEKERRQVVEDSLNLIPEEDSFLLSLFYFEEQSVKEIAAIIGINENHVKIKLYRGRKKLASVLKNSTLSENISHYEREQR